MKSFVDTQKHRSHPGGLEPAVFEAIWRMYKRGERDYMGGGVAPADAAEAVGTTRKTASEMCVALRDAGAVVPVDGADPDSYTPRRSFVPTPMYEEEERP